MKCHGNQYCSHVIPLATLETTYIHTEYKTCRLKSVLKALNTNKNQSNKQTKENVKIINCIAYKKNDDFRYKHKQVIGF